MSGLGGLNKSPNGVVLGMVQLQLPVVKTREDLARQTEKICAMAAKARRNLSTMDLVVFPEYALHGLSMDTNPEIMCRLDGPEVAAFKRACVENRIWGCFSIMELNPRGNPFNSGIIIDDKGALQLYYRKLHPWVPVEPWEPGDLGIPVCDTNQANAFCNVMVTASVCMCGSDGTFDSMGEGMFVNFDGMPLVEGGHRPDEIITCELRPDLVREARRQWSVENNIYQFGHRGYVAVKGGARDCPYTYMQDLVAGRYRLPWESEVAVTDGTSCGFEAPTREYAPRPAEKRKYG
jgi:formamidase